MNKKEQKTEKLLEKLEAKIIDCLQKYIDKRFENPDVYLPIKYE